MSQEYDQAKYAALVKEYEQFTYAVSHDLRAPIGQLQTLTHLLLDELDIELSPMQQKYKEMILHVGDNAEKILDTLLVFSRLNTDKKNIQPVKLVEVVNEAVKQLDISTKQLTIDLPSKKEVNADYDLLVTAFKHLLDNAFKFQPDGQIAQVNVDTIIQGGQDVIRISDNGIGMTADGTELAFILFRTLNERGAYEGEGVGLCLAKKIIDVLGGKLWLESEEGQGTSVYFSL